MSIVFLDHQARAQTTPSVEAEFHDANQLQYRAETLSTAQDLTVAKQATGPSPLNNVTLRIEEVYNLSGESEAGGSYSTPSSEFGPEAQLTWSRKLTSIPIKLEASLDLNSDTFAGSTYDSAEQENLSTSFTVKYYDFENDQAWQPFIYAGNSQMFDQGFSSWSGSQNDLSIGVQKRFNFDGNFHRLPISPRSAHDTVWSLELKAYGRRRFDSWDVKSLAIIVQPEVNYAPTDNLVFSLAVKTTKRWFDPTETVDGVVLRQDFSADPEIAISYEPSDSLFGGNSALQRILGSPEIAFQAEFEHQVSNISSKSSNEWTLAPALTASWRF